MVYPSVYLDEDNYENIHNLLQEMHTKVESKDTRLTVIASGEDATHIWESYYGKQQ